MNRERGSLVGDPLIGNPLVGDPLVGDPLIGNPLVGDLLAGKSGRGAKKDGVEAGRAPVRVMLFLLLTWKTSLPYRRWISRTSLA